MDKIQNPVFQSKGTLFRRIITPSSKTHKGKKGKAIPVKGHGGP
jgi:hypothetical protein